MNPAQEMGKRKFGPRKIWRKAKRPFKQARTGKVLLQAELQPFARYRMVPVHKRALWISAPRPDVQFEEIGQVKAMGRCHELKVLAVKRWRLVVVVSPTRSLLT